MKQLLPCFLSHPWVDCKEAADGADGRAECGKRGTSWGPSRYRYRKSATVTTSPPDVPVSLPSSIFDFVPGTTPSWQLGAGPPEAPVDRRIMEVGGEPVRISSMVLLVAYAFYYKNVFSIIIYHHMPRERRCLRHSGAQQ